MVVPVRIWMGALAPCLMVIPVTNYLAVAACSAAVAELEGFLPASGELS